MRKQRQEERIKRREQKQRERAANSDMAQNLLDEEREQGRQRKQMRKQEKQKTDQKLQEKLKRRKQQVGVMNRIMRMISILFLQQIYKCIDALIMN